MAWACDKIGRPNQSEIQGTVEGKRIRGMPKKTWIDKINKMSETASSASLQITGGYYISYDECQH